MQKEIENSLDILRDGKVLLYPTDTVWGLGCDATDAEAVRKIYHIKKRPDSKSMIILVSNFLMLQQAKFLTFTSLMQTAKISLLKIKCFRIIF